MQMLPPDIVRLCRLTFMAPREYEYTRTGVMADGHCFFHAVLRCLSAPYRNTSDPLKHVERAQRLRNELADFASFNTLGAVGNGEPRRLFFMMELNKILSEGFPEELGALNRIIPRLDSILEECSTPNSTKLVDRLIQATRKHIIAHIPVDQYERIQPHLYKFFIEVYQRATKESVRSFQEQLRTECAGSTEIEFISRATHVNFLFLHDRGGSIVPYPHHIYLNARWKTLIFLWVNENHYEPIGIASHTAVRRVFHSEDEIVKRIVKNEQTSATSAIIDLTHE